MPNFLKESQSRQVWSELLELVCQYVAHVASYVESQTPVILAFPGPIDSMGLIVAASSIFGHERNFPNLRETVAQLTGRPTFLLNDMSAATWYLSTVTDAQRFIAVTVSSGIGSKMFDRKSSEGVIDHLPYAGEIGHIVIDDDAHAPVCDCGVKGHLQAIASGRGIERAARREARANRPSFERSLCATKFGASVESVNNEQHLVPAAREYDEWALNVIRRCTNPLGHILAILTVAAGLDRIVITGGMAQGLGFVYVELLLESMRRYYSSPGFPFDLNIVQLCKPNAEVCLLGAATYAHLRLGIP